MDKALALALILSILFSIALMYLTIEIPIIIHKILLNFFPDVSPPSDFSKMHETINYLRPYGYTIFVLVFILVIVGFLMKSKIITLASAITIYLPIFGYFAFTMFFLAGIGILRISMIPILDIDPGILSLGSILYIPYELAVYISYILFGVDISMSLSFLIMFSGLTIFTYGSLTWLYGKFIGKRVIDFWAYKFSRHPQYVGYIIWSYGLLTITWSYGLVAPVSGFVYPRGGEIPRPVFLWLISIFIIVALAIYEEIKMIETYGEEYLRYRKKTPFLIHIPIVNRLITKFNRIIIKKDFPERYRETWILIIYFAIIIIISFILQHYSLE